jgi:hypothetical protein
MTYKRLNCSPVVDELPKVIVDKNTIDNPTYAYEAFDVIRNYLTSLDGRRARLVNLALCQCEAFIINDKPNEVWLCSIADDDVTQYQKWFFINAHAMKHLVNDRETLEFTVLHECAHVAVSIDKPLVKKVWQQMRSIVPTDERTNDDKLYYTWKSLFGIQHFHNDRLEDFNRQMKLMETVFTRWASIYMTGTKFNTHHTRHNIRYGFLNASEAVAQAVAMEYTDFKMPAKFKDTFHAIFELVKHELPQ